MNYTTKDITIVIPTWNGKELLIKHLPRVFAYSGKSRIVVVDDASDDGTGTYLAGKFPDIRVIRRRTRGGFAAAVNSGVAESTTPIVVLLNSDIEPEKDYLPPGIAHFSDPDMFAVGFLDKSMEHGQTVERGRGIMTWQRGVAVHRRGDTGRSDTSWASGGSAMFRKDIWDRLGGMDLLYNPFYWEDIDLSYRARKAGYRIAFEGKSVVRHYHETGAIRQKFSGNTVSTIAYRNQYIFIWKNITDTGLMMSHLLWLPYHLIRAVFRGDMPMLLGFARACILCPAILRSRKCAAASAAVSDRRLLSEP
ncbi:glycosyltransferase family 2 protein [Patescibacteria group bacterium]|nr:glycosyltransferase family 2 protein [Patescibacteria group bacterium]